MLVLSTKLEDGVRIGNDVRITVVDVRGRTVRLGIEAPQSIPIQREPASSASDGKAHATAQRGRPSTNPRRHRDTTARTAESNGCGNLASYDSEPSVLIVCRDQPLLSRLKVALHGDGEVQSRIVSSITDGKRWIAAQQAVDRESRPDLVVLDADISPQTAILFLHWLRQAEHRRVIPVLVLRGDRLPHSTAALLSAGANVVVNKDQSLDRVNRSIHSAIELWRCSEPQKTRADTSLQEHVA